MAAERIMPPVPIVDDLIVSFTPPHEDGWTSLKEGRVFWKVCDGTEARADGDYWQVYRGWTPTNTPFPLMPLPIQAVDTEDITANYHGGADTSVEAHESIIPDKRRLRALVYKMIEETGKWGATCDEAELALNLTHQSCSARFTELAKVGAIIIDGKRPTRSGRNARVYIAAKAE